MKTYLAVTALGLLLAASPAFAASSESDTSSTTSTTAASESGSSGDAGHGFTMGGAQVTAGNQATDASKSSISGGVVSTSSTGTDISQVAGMQFSTGTFGFDGSHDTQSGTSSGSATGSSSAHTSHHH